MNDIDKTHNIKVLKIISCTRAKSAFKEDQNLTLLKHGVHIDVLPITRGGVFGYLKTSIECVKKVKDFHYDIIHTHDIAAITSIFQRKAPVIMSFHGSDLKDITTRILCNISSLFSRYCLLSYDEQIHQLYLKRNYGILNSGIDLDIFYPVDMDVARKRLSLPNDKKIILFSGRFSDKIKNYALAKMAIDMIDKRDILIMELKGYTREEMMLLMNASDLLLVTSLSESGPNVTKEALACNTPVVSTKVGHKRIIDILMNTDGCYITDNNPANIANAINKVLIRNRRVDTRDKMIAWDIHKFADKTIAVYTMVISQNNKYSKLPKVIFPDDDISTGK
jgi:teichuronic acid biosynthesis glycosyltransferase TuaC